MNYKCPKCHSKLEIVTDKQEGWVSRYYNRCPSCRYAFYSEIQRYLDLLHPSIDYRTSEANRKEAMKELVFNEV